MLSKPDFSDFIKWIKQFFGGKNALPENIFCIHSQNVFQSSLLCTFNLSNQPCNKSQMSFIKHCYNIAWEIICLANEIVSVTNLILSFQKIWKKISSDIPLLFTPSWVNKCWQLLPTGCWLTWINGLVSYGKSSPPVWKPWALTVLLSFYSCVSALT